MSKLSGRRRDALDCIDAVPEGILRGTGAFEAFVFDNMHLCYLADAIGLARRGLCTVEKIGESTFVRITAKGRAELHTLSTSNQTVKP